jgi:peptidylprolyl isomerase
MNVVKKSTILLVILLMANMLVTGCAGREGLKMANDGDSVSVHYTGKLEDGTVFDSSLEREPLEFTLGEGTLIPGFEEAVRGMHVGQSKTVTIPPEEAYGPYLDEMVLVIEREQLPPELNPAVGQQLQMQQQDGRVIVVLVTDISETTITVDANHSLAGKDLIFDIELLEIK